MTPYNFWGCELSHQLLKASIRIHSWVNSATISGEVRHSETGLKNGLFKKGSAET